MRNLMFILLLICFTACSEKNEIEQEKFNEQIEQIDNANPSEKVGVIGEEEEENGENHSNNYTCEDDEDHGG